MLSFLSFFFLLFSSAHAAPATLPVAAPTGVQVADLPICRMYGSVYLTSDPRQKSYARYTVYVEKEETFADLLVFRENNKLFADRAGLWYVIKNRDFADHIFFVTTNRAFADFTIHYTDKRTFAGCKN